MALFWTTIAGSLPKPARLAEPNRLSALRKHGEQSRRHLVLGFVEFVDGIDFSTRVPKGIRDNRSEAMAPVVIRPVRLRGRVHAAEAVHARARFST